MSSEVNGYCDLNINSDSPNLKSVVLRALSLGYHTIAINTTISDDINDQDKNKSKKGGGKKCPPMLVPAPCRVELSASDLEHHGITWTPVLLTRITIIYSDPSKPFLTRAKTAIEQYDLIAFTPLTEMAYKQVCQTLMCVDLISLDITGNSVRFPRKLLKAALDRDIFFEIKYSPCIGSNQPALRQSTFELGHTLANLIASHFVIVSSGSSSVSTLRAPHDVANLSRFFGLSLGAATSAISTMCHDTVHCAKRRRNSANKCAPEIKIQIISSSRDDSLVNKAKRKLSPNSSKKGNEMLKKTKDI